MYYLIFSEVDDSFSFIHSIGIYILHQMIAYLRTNFINDSYCNPPYSFYEEIYKVYFILSYSSLVTCYYLSN